VILAECALYKMNRVPQIKCSRHPPDQESPTPLPFQDLTLARFITLFLS
jgi:hypothetical protein